MSALAPPNMPLQPTSGRGGRSRFEIVVSAALSGNALGDWRMLHTTIGLLDLREVDFSQ